MSAVSANIVGEQRFARPSPLFAAWQRAHHVLRGLFPVKTAACLADLTGLSQRAWELSLRERRQFAPDTLLALLDTPHGPDVLVALLADSEQPWVRDFKALWQIEKLKKERAALDAKIEALSRGEIP